MLDPELVGDSHGRFALAFSGDHIEPVRWVILLFFERRVYVNLRQQ